MTGRIVDSPALQGTRALLVDLEGGGDYSSIQQAIDEAAEEATVDERWQIFIAPGEYQENVVPADFIDLIGTGPGYATVIAPYTGSALTGFVEGTIANLKLKSTNAAVVTTVSRAPLMYDWHWKNIIIDQTVQYPIIDFAAGRIHLWNCDLGSGKGIEITSNEATLYTYYSIIRNKATSGSAHKVIKIAYGSMYLYYSMFLNEANVGYGIYIDNTPGTLKANYCTFRRKDSTYSVDLNTSNLPGGCTFKMHRCIGNATVNSLITDWEVFDDPDV